MAQSEKRLLNVREYAEYVGESIGGVYNKVSNYFRRGSTDGLYIPPIKRGRHVVFDKQRLDRVIDKIQDK